MRIITIVLIILSIATFAYAIDTNLGKVVLTKNQVIRLSELNGSLDGAVKGFSYQFDKETLIVVTNRELTEQEKTSLVNSTKALSGSAIPKEKSDIEKLQDRVTVLEGKVTKNEADIVALK